MKNLKTFTKIKKNDKCIVDILDYGYNGEGIAKIDGFTIFIPFSIVGEQVEIVVILVKKDFAIGKIINILKPSINRVSAPCPYFKLCGGCQLQHMNYREQLKYKTSYVQSSIKKYSGIDLCISPCQTSDNEYHYRNKFSFPIAKSGNEIVVGMYKQGSHNLIEIKDCLIQEECKVIIEEFLKWANKYSLNVYDENSKQGIRHLVARVVDNKCLLTIVATEKINNLKELYISLQNYYSVVHIVININTKSNNVILGDRDIVEFGTGELEIRDFGLDYTINCHSFMQVNNDIKTKLYAEVLRNIPKDSTVIDAYSGAGVLSAIIAKTCKKVFAVEIVKEANQNAEDLKRKNNIINLTNICGDCAVELPKLCSKLSDFIVVLDPPRKGCGRAVIDAINKSLPTRIIYISCNPSTLARDIGLLKNNYNIISAKPYDMFPQTSNVETLVVLEKNQ